MKYLFAFLFLLIPITASAQINPTNYGVRYGLNQSFATRRANYTNLTRAADAAMASNQAVHLAGFVEIDVPNVSPKSIRVRGGKHLKVTGAGRQASGIVFFAGSDVSSYPRYDCQLFKLDPGGSLTVTDVELRGPSDPGPNGEFNANVVGIYQFGQLGTNHKVPYLVRVERVDMTQEFYNAIRGNAGSGPLEVIDSKITGFAQCVAWQDTYSGEKSFIARNSSFTDAGLPTNGHLIYLSPSVAYEIDNCYFNNNFRYAIHHYGSSTLVPAFARLINTTFDTGCKDAMETAGAGLTVIKGCTFKNRGQISLKGNTDVSDSLFDRCNLARYGVFSNRTINVTNSRFTNCGIINSTWTNCTWNIKLCTFQNSSTAIGNNAAGTKTLIESCTFIGTIRRGVWMSAGQVTVKTCDFSQASFVEAAITADTMDTAAKLLVSNDTQPPASGRFLWSKRPTSGVIVRF